MVECVKCKVLISNRNKSGLCRNCCENKDNAVHYNTVDEYNDRSIDDLNNGLITDSSALTEAKKNTSLNNLSVAGIMNLISIVNIPIVEKLNDIRDNLRPRVEQIESKVEHLEKEWLTQRKIINNHQKFLESLANKDRQCNLIITGVMEHENTSNDISPEERETPDSYENRKVTEIMNILLPEDLGDLVIERIGNPETARKPRPIRVKLKLSIIRNKICSNSKLLKDKHGFDKIYVKKETHPSIRKENARIYKLVKTEEERPENQGCNIFYGWKTRVVKKDDVIIDRFNPLF